MKQDGQLREGDNLLTEEQLGGLLEYVKQPIAKAAGDIYGGALEMRPVSGAMGSACRYCEYAAICRFDDAYGANRRRVTEHLKKEEVLSFMEGKQDG